MDLANEGAARAIELLGPSDAVAVFKLDERPAGMEALPAAPGKLNVMRKIEWKHL
jgi:hypothetical protein